MCREEVVIFSGLIDGEKYDSPDVISPESECKSWSHHFMEALPLYAIGCVARISLYHE
jgi:hypothetical protein